MYENRYTFFTKGLDSKTNKEVWKTHAETAVPLRKDGPDIYVPTAGMYKLYCSWARKMGERNIPSVEAFGRQMTEVLGPSLRIGPVEDTVTVLVNGQPMTQRVPAKRPMGYRVVPATLGKDVEKAWNIQKEKARVD
jgi:hypothetical protein